MDLVSVGLFLVLMADFVGCMVYSIVAGGLVLWPLIPVAGTFALWNMYRYLWADHEYRGVDGRAEVRHGRLGKWCDLKEHMKSAHGVDIDDHERETPPTGVIR